ncbi:tetratricopeptide repeat protein [Thermoleptolyngbya oregonensis NK1-22]|uniref:Tetratricopeptide repeat protein n=1 Tax=Thermoleptolyngbya oregonensis NK1-22 TaxID=2547457 RepID=A0AA96Y1S0_9CYAN|nr:tetratricopeptide repeat protein [Thermoleptolyngbya oregonensis NK1-22]
MGTSVDITAANFAQEVTQKSYEKPVLVDFFATWCGPCQLLKPMLEKLSQEYDFVLAKVDIDQNPDLANAYGVEGVPDVRIVVDGAMQNGFVGVLPEPQLRELLGKLNLHSTLEQGLAEIRAARAAGDVNQVKQRFADLIQAYPTDARLMLEAAEFLVSQGQIESAEKLLSPIPERDKDLFRRAQAVRGLIAFHRDLASPAEPGELETKYRQAEQHALEGNYEAAFAGFLEIVAGDRKFRQDGARKAMIVLFDLLGDDHPLTRSYRKQLMQTMY